MNLICLALAVLVMVLGGGAMWLGFRGDAGAVQAKVGGSVIVVIGALGLIACVIGG